MEFFSPAKINLTLRVSGVRPDGYHELDSVTVPLSLGDRISLERTETLSLEVVSETVDLGALPADIEQNLAVRAVRLLERRTGRSLPVAIRIEKSIPMGGGLGGGSSNAATVLRGVNALFSLGLSAEELCALGSELGSDVALFVLDGLVRMRGRGEIVSRVPGGPFPGMHLVLANCGAHCATPRIYRAFDDGFSGEGLTNQVDLWDNLYLSLQKGESDAVAQEVVNDLEAPCFRLFPEVAETAEALRSAGCKGVRLCGSGATVFGFVDSREEGERVLAQPALAGCWRAITQTLPDGVMAAHGPLTPIVMVRIHVGQPRVAVSV